MPNIIRFGGTGAKKLNLSASVNDVLKGKTFSIDGKNTLIGNIPSLSAKTYTPSTVNQTISAKQYITGEQTIKGDSNLVASNIKSGVSLFGVQGSYVSSPIKQTATFYDYSSSTQTLKLEQSVNLANTLIFHHRGMSGSTAEFDYAPGSNQALLPYCKVSQDGTVTITKTSYYYDVVKIIEFSNVKSIQTGRSSFVNAVPINTVNPSKTMVISDYYGGESRNTTYAVSCYLKDANSVDILETGSTTTFTVAYAVIEFN